MTYLRVKFNFWMGFIFHLLWNLSAVIITKDYSAKTPENIEIKNDKYSLALSKTPLIDSGDKTILYSIIKDTIYQLESSKFSTKEILDIVSPDDKNYKGSSALINLDFKSEKGIHKDSLLSILEKEGYIKKQTPTN